jgi:hypothetical protein
MLTEPTVLTVANVTGRKILVYSVGSVSAPPSAGKCSRRLVERAFGTVLLLNGFDMAERVHKSHAVDHSMFWSN